MSTIFVSGSRRIDHLSAAFLERLENVSAAGHRVVVRDADGADTAVQAHYRDRAFARLTVFHSGRAPRNNLGRWPVKRIVVPGGRTGFAFHAVKDREMARVADYGLMIWDGASLGTILNALRLVQYGKASVLFGMPAGQSVTIRCLADWHLLVGLAHPSVWPGVRQRAAPAELAALA